MITKELFIISNIDGEVHTSTFIFNTVGYCSISEIFKRFLLEVEETIDPERWADRYKNAVKLNIYSTKLQ